jgi:hypothetical protein
MSKTNENEKYIPIYDPVDLAGHFKIYDSIKRQIDGVYPDPTAPLQIISIPISWRESTKNWQQEAFYDVAMVMDNMYNGSIFRNSGFWDTYVKWTINQRCVFWNIGGHSANVSGVLQLMECCAKDPMQGLPEVTGFYWGTNVYRLDVCKKYINDPAAKYNYGGMQKQKDGLSKVQEEAHSTSSSKDKKKEAGGKLKVSVPQVSADTDMDVEEKKQEDSGKPKVVTSVATEVVRPINPGVAQLIKSDVFNEFFNSKVRKGALNQKDVEATKKTFITKLSTDENYEVCQAIGEQEYLESIWDLYF